MSKISATQSALSNARRQIIDAFMSARFLSVRDSDRLQHPIEMAVHEIEAAIAMLEKFRKRYEEVPAKPRRPRSAA